LLLPFKLSAADFCLGLLCPVRVEDDEADGSAAAVLPAAADEEALGEPESVLFGAAAATPAPLASAIPTPTANTAAPACARAFTKGINCSSDRYESKITNVPDRLKAHIAANDDQ
jgi:hypothetical protein